MLPPEYKGHGGCLLLMHSITFLAAQLGLVLLLLIQAQLLLFLGAYPFLARLGSRVAHPFLGLNLLPLPLFLMDAFAILFLQRFLLRLRALLQLSGLPRTGHPAAHAAASTASGERGPAARQGEAQEADPQ